MTKTTKKPATKDAWMPLYIGAYLRKTARLTTEQHGAYLLLIMDYWVNGPLPDDEAALAQVAKLDPRKWKSMSATIRAFFTVQNGKLVHDRIERELETAGRIVEKRSEAGKAGAEARWGKRDGKGNGNDGGKPDGNAMANGMANGWQNGSQNDAPSPTPSPRENPNQPSSLPAVGVGYELPPGLDPRASEVIAKSMEILDNPSCFGWARVDVWLKSGADPEMDIYPALRSAKPKWRSNNLEFFDWHVANAKAARMKPMPAGNPRGRSSGNEVAHAQTPAEADELERINAGMIAKGSYQADVSLSQVKAMIAKGLLTKPQAEAAGYRW